MNTGPMFDSRAPSGPGPGRPGPRLPDVDAGRGGPRGVDPLLDRERVRHEEAAAPERVTLGIGQQRERPGSATAEAEALAGPARVGMLAEVLGPGGELLVAAVVERPRGDEVQRGTEDDKDEERRESAPGDELPADAADQAAVGAERVELGRVAARRRRPRQASLRRYPTPRTVSIREPMSPSFVRR